MYIPVGLYTATQDNDISFNQLCKEDNSRVKYKKVCAHCGKEVQSSDIVKGFEYEKDKSIHILHFTDLHAIRPIYYDKTYHAVPEAGGDKAFELLKQAMKQENKVAVVKTVMGTQEKLLALIPTADGMLVETMFFRDEVKDSPKETEKPAVDQAKLAMAKTLIGAMVKPFEPELYNDEYQTRLREIIEQKINGKEVTSAPSETTASVIDIMEALKASLAQEGISK